MRGRPLKTVAISALSVVLWALLVPATASAGANLRVPVGAQLFIEPAAQGSPADGMRFYAPPLNVHDGDAVTFVFDGFHTATGLPANADTDAFVQDEASGTTGAFSFVIDNPDDGGTAAQPALKANLSVLFPSVDGTPATCGSAADPCPGGSAVVNSGLPLEEGAEFTVAINGAVGDTLPFLCLVHHNMRLDVNVVDAGAAATTQAEIGAFRTAQVQEDATRAGRVHNRFVDRQTGTALAGGHTRWDAFAGIDGPGFALAGMYPAVLEVDRGDTVRWHSDRLIFEDHTVSMPLGTARDVFANTFVPLCDQDGDGSAPRTPPDQPPPTFCSTGEVEFAIPPKMAYERGNGTFRGADYENSGVFGSNLTSGVAPYDVTFASTSPGKGFRYFCLIHGPFMSGRVVVA
jgi:plastocyanin